MWWKYLTAGLLLYAFTYGMLVPLKPGIESVSPSSADLGQTVTLQVKGYNTSFFQGKDGLRAWLKLDSVNAIVASGVQVKNEQFVDLTFKLPNTLPSGKDNAQPTLLIDDPSTGAAIFPSALSVGKAEQKDSTNTAIWTAIPSDFHLKDDFAFPYRNVLNETIRSLYYHVPLWFAMIALFTASLIFSIIYLLNARPDGDFQKKREADWKASATAQVGLIFGVLGLLTGMVWANYTWGKPWSGDIKQNMSAVLLMVYFAYFILRMAFDDDDKAARLGAVYNIFAYASIFPLLFVIPRMADSLHPGNGGNPAMGGEDLDNTMRMVFYPSVIAFILLGFWLAQMIFRLKRVYEAQFEEG